MASNIKVYDRTGFLYDAVIGPISREARDRAVTGLNLPPEGRLLVAGVGSGLDLPHLPRGVRGVAVDLSDGMLRRARKRRAGLGMPFFELRKMDARSLDLPDESFDAVYLPLIVANSTREPHNDVVALGRCCGATTDDIRPAYR